MQLALSSYLALQAPYFDLSKDLFLNSPLHALQQGVVLHYTAMVQKRAG